MGSVSPGQLFLEKQKSVTNLEDVLNYAEFLRNETGLNGILPVDIRKIFEHFDLPEPHYVPLPQQQGLLLDPDNGVIAINSTDPEKRQKFTKVHELVEMLFILLPQGQDLGQGWELRRPGGFKESAKEYLCNRAAANLLMPPDFVHDQIKKCGMNFECAKAIATVCDVSLSAALVQLAQLSNEGYFVILWQMKNKPSEIRDTSNDAQMIMFEVQKTIPAKKLRVKWSLGGVNSPYIPNDKSTENSSLIYQAWETNTFTNGRGRMTFDNRNSAWYFSENLPFTAGDETCVISLMRKN